MLKSTLFCFLEVARFKYLYHWAMATYYGWSKRRLIQKFRLAGEKKGLPSLSCYTDDAIVEGLRRLHATKT